MKYLLISLLTVTAYCQSPTIPLAEQRSPLANAAVDQLTAKGVNYGTELAASQLGIFLDKITAAEKEFKTSVSREKYEECVRRAIVTIVKTKEDGRVQEALAGLVLQFRRNVELTSAPPKQESWGQGSIVFRVVDDKDASPAVFVATNLPVNNPDGTVSNTPNKPEEVQVTLRTTDGKVWKAEWREAK